MPLNTLERRFTPLIPESHVRKGWNRFCFLFALIGLLHPVGARSECIPFHDNRQHIGATHPITGKGVRVKEGDGAVTYLDFRISASAPSQWLCFDTVVVFRRDLRRVENVRQLGRQNGGDRRRSKGL